MRRVEGEVVWDDGVHSERGDEPVVRKREELGEKREPGLTTGEVREEKDQHARGDERRNSLQFWRGVGCCFCYSRCCC